MNGFGRNFSAPAGCNLIKPVKPHLSGREDNRLDDARADISAVIRAGRWSNEASLVVARAREPCHCQDDDRCEARRGAQFKLAEERRLSQFNSPED